MGTFTVSTDSPFPQHWYITAKPAWATISPDTGSAPPGQTPTLTADVSGLPFGDQWGTVAISCTSDTASLVVKIDYPVDYITGWGSYGNGDGQFDRPVAVAVNSAGEVYVGDARQRYVQRFSSTGQFLGRCIPIPVQSIYCPVAMALAVDRSTDKVFASDPLQYAVQVYSRDLTPITGWNGSGGGGVGVAYGIAIGPTRDVYIAGGAGHSVSRWTQDGALIQRWADPGPGPSRLSSAWAIAVDASGFV